MKRIIDIEALNLRSAPEIADGNRIAVLHLGQEVDTYDSETEPGWLSVSTSINGTTRTGYLKAQISGQPSLRSAASAPREALASAAITEWLRFQQGQGQEHQAPFHKYVGEMWAALSLQLDGKDRDQYWSAAAISFMVRNASAKAARYKKFKFAAAHAKYMHDAIAKRSGKVANAPFWGYRLHEVRPEIGDIVCKWRETPRDYDDAAASDAFKGHCDIIVSVRPDYVLAIGGNVRNSVNITRYKKTGAGYLAPLDGVFMHLVNRV